MKKRKINIKKNKEILLENCMKKRKINIKKNKKILLENITIKLQ